MRIGVVSDTHITSNTWDLPEKLIEDFKNVDMIIHAGDLADLSVLNKLKSVCSDVRAVWGNMDPPEVRNKLPQKEIIVIAKHKIAVMHGWGHPNNLVKAMEETFKQEGVDLIIFGHSHAALNEEKDGIIYFNPGSLTDKAYAAYNSYGIIEINDKIEAKIIKL